MQLWQAGLGIDVAQTQPEWKFKGQAQAQAQSQIQSLSVNLIWERPEPKPELELWIWAWAQPQLLCMGWHAWDWPTLNCNPSHWYILDKGGLAVMGILNPTKGLDELATVWEWNRQDVGPLLMGQD